ncbi:MAG: hypothetical protein COT25_04035 [Candidatus Kerfeldbacteria bacterium CG08_land_8_20_14_0_20_42_7]|uniref:Uncharacterized protein n=1 Tax=Candidatus Kerfeldbacteria bacterium CG08_land_8_20_14_0_20_42_7 TaxID=2014245 RepID=A0A2H0YS34_9BACT|nr:MAG: hypothetical protein COT25_04035 [Candidatus Kerfeldbacteria bacterium CG08_land_8_20_14_0_20_42_7]
MLCRNKNRKIDIDRTSLRVICVAESYNKFRKIALGKSKEKKAEEAFDMKAYAVYLLTEGSMAEKQELLANLKSRLTMKNKVLALEGAA